MKLSYAILYVPDVAAAVQFYERAFGLRCRFVHESGQYAEMETGATALAFASEALAGAKGVAIRPDTPRDIPAGVEICLVTDAPEEAYDHAVASGAAPVKPVETKPLGAEGVLRPRPERLPGRDLLAGAAAITVGTRSIRPTVPADLRALRGIIDANGLFPGAMLNDMARAFLAGEGGEERWLTVDDGGPVAVAYYFPERVTDGTHNLLLIAVAPDRHGQGIGAALMRHVERDLAARGGRVLLVETSGLDAFARTRRFYRFIGYDEEARIREFYAAGEDKVVFRKALAG